MSGSELVGALDRRETSSVELVGALIARIEAIDSDGPRLRSVLEVAPDALEMAAERDRERGSGQLQGPLHGIPVLVKDNVDTTAPLHTTVGSLVFGTTPPARDASLVSALRAAGAIVLGKTNLSEWANFRSRPSASGWSGAGGQTRNPHALDRSPGGSSAGSGAAVAAGLAPLAVGTETDGSIICPSACSGIVGLKPTVGLVSRHGIAPIAASQDTAGPMARTIEDVALLLEVLAGAAEEQLAGPVGRRPDGYETHYRALLGDGGLAGLRVGVLRDSTYFGYHPPTDEAMGPALQALRDAGADVVDPLPHLDAPLMSGDDEVVVMTHEFKAGLEAYFAERSGAARAGDLALPKSLGDLLEFNASTPGERTDVFGQQLIEASAAAGSLGDRAYVEARARNWDKSRSSGLDRLLDEHRLDAIAVPAMPPAWLIDHVDGDSFLGGGWAPPAVAGYPSLAVPVAMLGGLPVSLALWGSAWSEATLLRIGHSIERSLGPAPRPAFVPSVSLRA
jgi:amidase